jgi:hypothetical protein
MRKDKEALAQRKSTVENKVTEEAVFKLTINTPLIHCSLSPLRLPLSIKVSKLL